MPSTSQRDSPKKYRHMPPKSLKEAYEFFLEDENSLEGKCGTTWKVHTSGDKSLVYTIRGIDFDVKFQRESKYSVTIEFKGKTKKLKGLVTYLTEKNPDWSTLFKEIARNGASLLTNCE